MSQICFDSQEMNGSEQKERKSSLISRNITVQGRRTSVRLEPEMWCSIKDIAFRERCSIHDLCSLISLRKSVDTSLTAAIRVFLMLYYKAGCTEEGHRRAGHGNFENMKRRAGMNDVEWSSARLEDVLKNNNGASNNNNVFVRTEGVRNNAPSLSKEHKDI